MSIEIEIALSCFFLMILYAIIRLMWVGVHAQKVIDQFYDHCDDRIEAWHQINKRRIIERSGTCSEYRRIKFDDYCHDVDYMMIHFWKWKKIDWWKKSLPPVTEETLCA